MNRKILLVEPNYKNKYPPLGLMKLSTYFKKCNDKVYFIKGDMYNFIAELLTEQLIHKISINFDFIIIADIIFSYIKKGEEYEKISDFILKLDLDIFDKFRILDIIKSYRDLFLHKNKYNWEFFDIVCITTLFTFEWKITIDTINEVKKLCKQEGRVLIGGIASSMVPEEIFKETGIYPIIGLLDKPGIIDENNSIIIDSLPLDYSILYEIDYKYPTSNAYFVCSTKGCVNKCPFCAVPNLEPTFVEYKNFINQINETIKTFGHKKDLLFLDNNVLASSKFENIINDIKELGFKKGDKFIGNNEYQIIYKNYLNEINERGYKKALFEIYDSLVTKLESIQNKFRIAKKLFNLLDHLHCNNPLTINKIGVIRLHPIISRFYDKYLYSKNPKNRYVDFNQGIEGKRLDTKKSELLASIAINPLRIAFDKWSYKDFYISAVTNAAKSGIKKMSNYLLYNFDDMPDELYKRIELSINLSNQFNIEIFSFPMKYHPLTDIKWFKNRNYIGKFWCKKYLRAIQIMTTPTRGKIGYKKEFFYADFGETLEEFLENLMLPDKLLYERYEHDEQKRIKFNYKKKSNNIKFDNITGEWRNLYRSLNDEQKKIALSLISNNKFDNLPIINDEKIQTFIKFYI